MARPLSARETEILGWLREGKSNYEVGCVLGSSALTVENHLLAPHGGPDRRACGRA